MPLCLLFVYVCWSARVQGVMKISVSPEWGVSAPAQPGAVHRTLWFPADRSAFAQEPVFVPRRGAAEEDDGWVLTLVFSAAEDRTSLVSAQLVRVAMLWVANAMQSNGAPGLFDEHDKCVLRWNDSPE